MKLAVIPARGGSKRIPGKNIKSFHGRPMLAWSVRVALQSGLFDRVIVSTDDPAIADCARDAGAEVPFMRPSELSSDNISTIQVIAHAIEWAEADGMKLEAVCCIYATAPFMQVSDLAEGYRRLSEAHLDYVFSAVEFPGSVFRGFIEQTDGGIEMLYPEHFNTRSQDLPNVLHDAAQFYWGRPEAWRDGRVIFSSRSRVVRIPHWRVQDIDTPDDWTRAELLAPTLLDGGGM